MANFVLNGLSSVPRAVGDREQGVVGPAGVLSVTGATPSITLTDRANLIIAGTVTAAEAQAVSGTLGLGGNTGSNLSVAVGSGGMVLSHVSQAGGAFLLTLRANTYLAFNNGGMVSSRADAIWIRSSTSTDANAIGIANSGIIDSTFGDGVRAGAGSGGSARMANSGRVTSSGTTISLAGAQSDLVNSGEILRMASGGTAVNMGGAARLDNLGRIVGNVITSNESDRIVNSGTIDGSVVTNDGNDTVNNTGLILGSMSLGNGNDRADLRGGRVTDFVSGGAGDDTFLVDDTPVILVETPNNGTDRVISVAQTFALPDNIETLVLLSAARVGVGNDQDNTITGTDLANTLSGGAGNDTIEGLGGDDRVEGGVGDDLIGGGAGADTILGGFGNDLATGGAGRDWAYGETGNDTIHGDEGDDFLFGGAGSDVLFGNTEDDALDGGADNDTLDGGAGNDTLTGGLGSDSLIGGPGRDVFRFLTTAESPNNVGRDIIALFTRGEDLIDLTALDGDPALGGNQPLSFIGTAPLTGPGQVRVLMVGADAYVQVNTIGVAPAEMMIFVRGPGLLEASDFLL